MTQGHPSRYDLVSDLGGWLVHKRLVTKHQYEEALAEQQRGDGQYIPLSAILIRRGAISRDQMEGAQKALTLFDLPVDSSGKDPMLMPPPSKLLMMILGMVVRSSATALRFITSGTAIQVSYHVDGEWYGMESIPLHLFRAMIDVSRRVSAADRLFVRADSKLADVVIRPLAPVEGEGLMMEIEYPAA